MSKTHYSRSCTTHHMITIGDINTEDSVDKCRFSDTVEPAYQNTSMVK